MLITSYRYYNYTKVINSKFIGSHSELGGTVYFDQHTDDYNRLGSFTQFVNCTFGNSEAYKIPREESSCCTGNGIQCLETEISNCVCYYFATSFCCNSNVEYSWNSTCVDRAQTTCGANCTGTQRGPGLQILL